MSGDDLDPAEISRLLGAEPTSAKRKGEVWRTRLGAERTARTGIWRREATAGSLNDLDAQIVSVIKGLTDDTDTWNSLGSRFKVGMFCGLFLDDWNQGLSLRPKTLLLLGSRGITLGLDIYGGGDEEEVATDVTG